MTTRNENLVLWALLAALIAMVSTVAYSLANAFSTSVKAFW